MTKTSETAQKKPARPSLTKVAFLVVCVVLVVGLVKNWMESRSLVSSGTDRGFVENIFRGSGPVDSVEAAEIFSRVLPSLDANAFFGNSQTDDGYRIIVAGFVGEERPGTGQNEDRTYLTLYPYLYDQRAPIFLDITDGSKEVTVVEREESTPQSFDKARSELSKRRPVALTFFFPNEATVEFIYMKMSLEQLSDKMRFDTQGDISEIIFNPEYLTTIQLF